MGNKVDIDELSIILEKIKMYKEEEEIDFNDINDLLSNINYNYNTGNRNNLDMLGAEITNNLNIISKIHNTNISILEKNINKILENELKVIQILNDK